MKKIPAGAALVPPSARFRTRGAATGLRPWLAGGARGGAGRSRRRLLDAVPGRRTRAADPAASSRPRPVSLNGSPGAAKTPGRFVEADRPATPLAAPPTLGEVAQAILKFERTRPAGGWVNLWRIRLETGSARDQAIRALHEQRRGAVAALPRSRGSHGSVSTTTSAVDVGAVLRERFKRCGRAAMTGAWADAADRLLARSVFGTADAGATGAWPARRAPGLPCPADLTAARGGRGGAGRRLQVGPAPVPRAPGPGRRAQGRPRASSPARRARPGARRRSARAARRRRGRDDRGRWPWRQSSTEGRTPVPPGLASPPRRCGSG